MNTDKFWQKASDIYTIHHTRYKHSLLTDEETEQTAKDYVEDVMALLSEWFNPPGEEVKKL